jgi:hypothetical protein
MRTYAYANTTKFWGMAVNSMPAAAFVQAAVAATFALPTVDTIAWCANVH